MFVVRDKEVVALNIDGNAQSFKGIGYQSEVLYRHVLDAYALPNHSGHTDERAYFNHVGQHLVGCPMQSFNPFDGKQVAAYAANACPHAVKQSAKLLNVGFASSIIDGGCALSQHCGHDNVGRSCYRCLIKQHVTPLQLVGSQLVNVAVGQLFKACTEHAKAPKVGV